MEQSEKSKILLIDDDTSLLMMLGDFLKFGGYEVVTADSGEEGLRRIEKMSPDLIILDMSMPGMGGIGFLKAITTPSGRPRYPVLVLTARANMAEFFADVPVDGFIAKPCDTDDLLDEVGRIIFLRRGDRQAQSGGGRRKVLLGEDDEAIRKRVVRAFGDANYVVDVASSGPEVLERAIVGRPDAIVCKLILKAMNGDAVANMLKEMPNTAGIPVIIYDDSGSASSPSAYNRSGARVVAVVGSNASADLVNAADSVLPAKSF
ncbi:MAG: response regulator [Lentisphaerae bacterium]|nr:response regulator [Lentisphaerota bacterium]